MRNYRLIHLPAFGLLFCMPFSLSAWSWDCLWSTADQQAAQLYRQGQLLQAQEKFQNPDWRGAVSYQLEDYDTAAEMFAQNRSAEGLYNYGTTKAKQGDFEAALEAYRSALALQPDHEDALYNKKLIEEQQQQKKGGQNKEQENQEQQNQQPNSGQGSQQGANEQQSKDSPSQNEQQPPEKSDAQQEQQQSNDPKKQPDAQEQKSAEQPKAPQNKDDQPQDSGGTSNQDSLTEESKEQYRNQVNEQLQQQEQQPPPQEMAQNEEQAAQEQQRQIDDRWLQRIPDDPGGLLRRKFLYQYQQTHGKQR